MNNQINVKKLIKGLSKCKFGLIRVILLWMLCKIEAIQSPTKSVKMLIIKHPCNPIEDLLQEKDIILRYREDDSFGFELYNGGDQTDPNNFQQINPLNPFKDEA